MAKRRSYGDGNITQLPSGSYRARLKHGYDIHSKTFTTKREARAWISQTLAELTTGQYVNPSAVTLSDWWDTWVETYKRRTVSPATLDSYSFTKSRLSPKLLSMPLNAISTALIQSELNSLVDSGLKRRTIEITRTALNMCLGRAVQDKMIRDNPVTGTSLPGRDAEAGKPLTQQEEMNFVKLCRQYDGKTINSHQEQDKVIKYCLLLILRLGCRPSEGTGLTWDDYTDNLLHVRGTKTVLSDRWLPVTAEVREILNEMKKLNRPSEYIFCTKTGQRLQKDNLRRHMNTLTGHSVKDLRHTFATRAAQAGINPKTLMTILGHSNVQTTLQYYTHITPEDQAAAMEKISSECHASVTKEKIVQIS